MEIDGKHEKWTALETKCAKRETNLPFLYYPAFSAIIDRTIEQNRRYE